MGENQMNQYKLRHVKIPNKNCCTHKCDRCSLQLQAAGCWLPTLLQFIYNGRPLRACTWELIALVRFAIVVSIRFLMSLVSSAVRGPLGIWRMLSLEEASEEKSIVTVWVSKSWCYTAFQGIRCIFFGLLRAKFCPAAATAAAAAPPTHATPDSISGNQFFGPILNTDFV